MRADAHWAQPDLEVRQRLALDPIHGNHRDGHSRENNEHIDQRPKLVSRLARRQRASEIRHHEIRHQRSTSPSKMSIVAITATTSATNKPRTMMSRACKLTNDGGRTRRR